MRCISGGRGIPKSCPAKCGAKSVSSPARLRATETNLIAVVAIVEAILDIVLKSWKILRRVSAMI